ncbi:MAG TPA: GNA1162 family protein [Candidatus Limnocylindria bacterium]|nr:GNA1162 family protein [Candidatus Limnocylindria bacterium]
MRRGRAAALVLLAAAAAAGCATAPPHDYAAYRAHYPHSILVLPPENQTVDVTASYDYLATITRPLAEAGYYVFPVAVVDAFMKENGLPTPAEMHAVSLAKLREVTGADAVLYVTIEEWGQKYRIISSDTVVRARARLVDVATGATLWSGTAEGYRSSAAGQSDPFAMLLAAVLTQVLSGPSDPAHQLARTANHTMVFDQRSGLLLGPRHPRAAEDLRGR